MLDDVRKNINTKITDETNYIYKDNMHIITTLSVCAVAYMVVVNIYLQLLSSTI